MRNLYVFKTCKNFHHSKIPSIQYIVLLVRLKWQSDCEPYTVKVDHHRGCLSAIQFGTRSLQHLSDVLSISTLLDLLHNIRLTLAHPLHRICGLIEAFIRTSKGSTTTSLLAIYMYLSAPLPNHIRTVSLPNIMCTSLLLSQIIFLPHCLILFNTLHLAP